MLTRPFSTHDFSATKSDRSGKRKRATESDTNRDGLESSSDLNGETLKRAKRIKAIVSPAQDGDLSEFSTSEGGDESSHPERQRKPAKRTLCYVSVGGPVFPRSHYEGWTPPLTPTDEFEAILDLKAVSNQQNSSQGQEPEFTLLRLDNFSVYRPDDHKSHAYQLSSLDRLKSRYHDEFMFDGVLSFAEEKRFVKGARFGTLTVEGYGDADVTDLTGRLCIQSDEAAAEDVYYQLGQPAPEYRRFYEPFVWLAQFAKYYVDFLLAHKHVTFDDFRRNFYEWLFAQYSNQRTFKLWLDKCNLRDFRTTVAAHVGFLYKECYSIDDRLGRLLKHPIWGEVDPVNLTAIPRRTQEEKQTIVTPFAYDCFKHMYFAEHLELRGISHNATLDKVRHRKQQLGLTPFRMEHHGNGLLTPHSMPRASSLDSLNTAKGDSLNIAKGDVVRIQPNSASRWKSSVSIWYAYVQSVYSVRDTTNLDVIWLYESSDTTMGAASYPYSNELFFSDNCACGKDAIDIRSIIDKVDISLFIQDPTSVNGLFVRQKFRTIHDEDNYDFVSLKKTDLNCGCHDRKTLYEECRTKFQIGDTVLYRNYNSRIKDDNLEPGQIIDFALEKRRVVLRRFQRKTEIDPRAKANEVLITEEIIEKAPSKIIRHCQVRVFHPEVFQEGLPMPYNQNGAGDFFFILSRASSSDVQQASDMPFLPDSWDPDLAPTAKKLIGMGIFCGGGNLDRGLEDGGAVEFEYAVDIAKHALHTYRANVTHPERMQTFLGSVDDYLAQAMAGSRKSYIAEIGQIDLLAAGSPCPGFSTVNIKKLDPRALRNCSMVASVVSYVDFYCPEYCFLENVVPMTRGMGPNKEENVFAQILAAFVAMGYQVQQFLMDSWSFGSSQQRTRVFIVASAPGLGPLQAPPHTHCHPQTNQKLRNIKLGQSSNGLPFGVRRNDYTPFEHVSPLQATRDLADIGDSLPQLCPSAPDHRTPSEVDNPYHSCFAVVPTHPRGMGIVQAVQSGDQCNSSNEQPGWCSTITGQLREEIYEKKIKNNRTRSKKDSKICARIFPDRLFPTLLTTLRATDALNGRTLHWDQPRNLTVMEARRAQGFLDHEVLIGSPLEQIKIIGNSVDRKVALALGLQLRKSWLSKSSDGFRYITQHDTQHDTQNVLSDNSEDDRYERGPGDVGKVAGKAWTFAEETLQSFSLGFRSH